MKYIILVITFFLINLINAEEIVIYSIESAQYSANDCCILNIITNQNADELNSKSCFDTANYGCMRSKSAPGYSLDISSCLK